MKIKTIVLLASVVLMLMTGCSSSQKVALPPDENRELALKHFLEGSLLDQKGDVAKAILEYQDALHFKQDPAIYHVMAKDYSILDKHELAIQMGREAIRLDQENSSYHESLADLFIVPLYLDGA